MEHWWEIFVNTGNPEAYINFKNAREEEPYAAPKDNGDSGQVSDGGRLQ